MWLHRVSHGIDERPIVTHSEPVSMSRETTFERNLHPVRDREELGTAFTRLCEQVAADLQRKGYVSRKIGIKIRFDNFKTVTRDLTLQDATADPKMIRHSASQNLKRIELSKSIRLLGVKAGSLQRPNSEDSRELAQFILKL
jgi:DNA polymerase-4